MTQAREERNAAFYYIMLTAHELRRLPCCYSRSLYCDGPGADRG